MRRKAVVLLTMGFLLELSFPWLAEARVVRFIVEQRRVFAELDLSLPSLCSVTKSLISPLTVEPSLPL